MPRGLGQVCWPVGWSFGHKQILLLKFGSAAWYMAQNATFLKVHTPDRLYLMVLTFVSFWLIVPYQCNYTAYCAFKDLTLQQILYWLISQSCVADLLAAMDSENARKTQTHSPGRVGSPLSGIGRASTGSTAEEIRKKFFWKRDESKLDINLSI